MDFNTLFDGVTLEFPEEVGVISVDTLNREWELIERRGNRLIVRHNNKKNVMLGKMGHRTPDGKAALQVEVKGEIDHGVLCGIEYWHIRRDYCVEAFDMLHETLTHQQLAI